MKILVAPQEFKGTLTALQAARAISRGIEKGWPGVMVDMVSLADGGGGTVDAFLASCAGGVERLTEVTGPLGGPVRARWALFGDLAIIEMAAASGLVLLRERAPLDANTFGTGQLIAAAIAERCTRVLVGCGGSATTDAGAGALSALGVRLLDANGNNVPPSPRHFDRIARIERFPVHPDRVGRNSVATGLPERSRGAPATHDRPSTPLWENGTGSPDQSYEGERSGDSVVNGTVSLELLTDVTSPLLGPNGTAAIFAPQKGADAQTCALLERQLTHFASVVGDRGDAPGSGAAGGLAYGLSRLAGGQIVSGFETIASALNLDARVSAADVVITGEGKLDVQTELSKGPGALAQRARAHGKRVIAFVGSGVPNPLFDAVIPAPGDASSAASALEEAARRWSLQQRK